MRIERDHDDMEPQELRQHMRDRHGRFREVAAAARPVNTYHYQQGCGWRDRFEETSDTAAIAHARRKYHQDPEYDGDEARLYRVSPVHDPETGESWEDLDWIHHWKGRNMIPDPFNERGSFTDLNWHGEPGGC